MSGCHVWMMQAGNFSAVIGSVLPGLYSRYMLILKGGSIYRWKDESIFVDLWVIELVGVGRSEGCMRGGYDTEGILRFWGGV